MLKSIAETSSAFWAPHYHSHRNFNSKDQSFNANITSKPPKLRYSAFKSPAKVKAKRKQRKAGSVNVHYVMNNISKLFNKNGGKSADDVNGVAATMTMSSNRLKIKEKQFPALIGLEIVVNYVKQHTN
ncbi:hypothetical protein CHUAL_012464 [Chamberlinius hualienensis]